MVEPLTAKELKHLRDNFGTGSTIHRAVVTIDALKAENALLKADLIIKTEECLNKEGECRDWSADNATLIADKEAALRLYKDACDHHDRREKENEELQAKLDQSITLLKEAEITICKEFCAPNNHDVERCIKQRVEPVL